MNSIARYFHWLVVFVAAIFLASKMTASADRKGPMNFEEFGKLPIVDGGRVKPIDSLARNTMMAISNRQTFYDVNDQPHSAVRWLLDVMVSNPNFFSKFPAEKHEVFRIEHDQILNLLGLKYKKRPKEYRYSIDEFRSKLEDLDKQALRVLELTEQKKPLDLFDNKIMKLRRDIKTYLDLAQWKSPLVLPPPSASSEEWEPLLKGLAGELKEERTDGPARSFVGILLAYAKGDAEEFNRAVAGYSKLVKERLPEQTEAAGLETFFNRFAPFYQCILLYIGVFALAAGAWFGWSGPLNRASFWLAVLTLAVHTCALIARVYISGRPPVTNLYSSAIFIGWGCGVLALILEVIYRNGIGNVVAAIAGAVTLVIAHNLAAAGDTMEMLQAVLDTNFWLSTHVVCITAGYAATFIAGLLGVIFILQGVFTPTLDRHGVHALGRMIYGVICFALLLSFTGTVLGGIWADQSWGRFWGWDPKENGALLIVIWNALILHARWGGMIKQRGMAVLVLVGNIITAWSWFGVNMLGVGLHSYGFMQGADHWLIAFVFSQLGLIALGLLPISWWRSFAARSQTP